MSELDEEYRLDYFEQEGFTRKECDSCGAYFWTRDETREICGEPPCEQYEFIGNPGFDESYTLESMREEFLSFFEERDHERIDPYPVAANRWRDDVLLTQASIYDFQPLVTSGQAPPPANPLCISQPSIRMEDIQNVGKTGRHTMAFEMMAHHAFNTREDAEDYAYHGEVYWKDQTVQYCDEFFESMGADPEEITYIEDPWVGGGNAGPAIEVIYRGVELATLVFMSMDQDPEGEYEMKDGNRYSKMDTYAVDTGYGLERWTWVSQGTPTVYEAVYPEMIEFLKENAGIDLTDEEESIVHRAATLAGNLDIDEAEDMENARADIADELGVEAERLRALMEPLETIYAIADHSRTLAYMLGDGIVPSNVDSGYLVRMVLRRTKRLVDTVGVDAPLDELVDMQAKRLGYTNRDTIRDMVRTELEKYSETLDRGGRRVRQLADEYAERGEQIDTEQLIELYDSHGLQPDMVAEIAEDHGTTVAIPDDFFSLVAARHSEKGEEESQEREQEESQERGLRRIDEQIAELPSTEKLYYDDQDRMEFEAIVLDVIERNEGYDVVLDQTMFYPEGGGQPADRGSISTDDSTVDVRDVQQRDGIILHHTDEDPGKGEFIRGQIDTERRQRLMAHHTATHIIGHATRQVLGDHIRQAGAQKGTDSSRLDVTHYERISRKERQRIEQIANRIVRDNTPVVQEWPDRNVAEEQYGFDIYQGGIPPGTDIRLIHVDDDVQACAGTHVSRTGNIGCIKISSTERIQDGVERIVFSAGDAAIETTQQTEDALATAGSVLDVSPLDVPETAERFFEEWKDRGKQIDSLKEQLAEIRAQSDSNETIDIDDDGNGTAVVQRLDADEEELRATATAIVENDTLAVLASGRDSAQFVVAVPDSMNVNAGEVVSELASHVGGGGGGPPDFAQGGGPDVAALDDALADAPEILKRKLNA